MQETSIATGASGTTIADGEAIRYTLIVIIVEVRSAIFSRFECGKRPPQPSARKPLEPVSKVPTSILDSDGPLSETGSGRSAAAAGNRCSCPFADLRIRD
jgi:hypothetical protein